jgi:glutaredoxin
MKKLSILIIAVFVFAGCGGQTEEDPRLTEIAQCLTDNDVKMYGAVWCGHCNSQKDAFGPSFAYIQYIECDPNTNIETAKECVEKNIETVPAWEIPGQEMLFGMHDPEDLAEKLGC